MSCILGRLGMLPPAVIYTLSILHGLVLSLLLLIFVTLCTPIYLFRWCVIQYAAHFKDFGKPINATGNLFAVEFLPSLASRPPKCACLSKLVIDGNLSTEELTEIVSTRWFGGSSAYPELTQYPETFMGFMFWKPDPNFELKNHIHYRTIEASTDEEFERQLTHLSEELINKPFPPQRSPWECFLVQNYRNAELMKESENREMSVLIMRCHHVLADGYSAVYTIMEGLLGTEMEDIPLPTAKQLGMESSMEKILFGLSLPFRMMRDLSFFVNLEWEPVTPFHAWNKENSTFIHERSPNSIQVQKLKAIKNKLGVSFTAVILSAMAAGMSKAIVSLQKGGKKGKPLEFITTHTPLPLPGHPGRELVNHVTVTVFQLPTSPELDPVERLRKSEAALETAKRNTIPLLFLLLIKAFGSLCTVMTEVLVKNRRIPAGITNFPGPDIDIRLNNKRGLEADLVAGLLQGVMGFGVSVASFKNKIRVSVVVDKEVMDRKELKRVVSNIEQEIELLYDIATK